MQESRKRTRAGGLRDLMLRVAYSTYVYVFAEAFALDELPMLLIFVVEEDKLLVVVDKRAWSIVIQRYHSSSREEVKNRGQQTKAANERELHQAASSSAFEK